MNRRENNDLFNSNSAPFIPLIKWYLSEKTLHFVEWNLMMKSSEWTFKEMHHYRFKIDF